MDRDRIEQDLRNLINDYLMSRSLELVELIFRYEGRDLFLRILTDRPEGGITLDECALINKEIGIILDEKDILQNRYILEVSSPGLDRPLKTKNDFMRSIGKKAKFFLYEPVNGKIEWDGIIRRVEQDSVGVDIRERILVVPISKINKAKPLI